MDYGTMIERGRIQAIARDENGETLGYEVASLDRKGIVSPPIQPINEREYTMGDMVCFFMYPDGTGKIVCAM